MHRVTATNGVAAVLFVTSLLVVPDRGGYAAATKVHSSQGTTLAQVKAQAAAESVRTPTRMKMTATATAQTSVTQVQGPTNLATNIGGSWNNYAFTIPNDPSCTDGKGTTMGGTSATSCPNGANGASGAVHAVQLYDGKVLIMAGSGNQWMNLQPKDFTSWVWDPTQSDQTKAWKFIPTPYDMFCAGHVVMSNGNVLITGGSTAYPQYDSSGNLVHDWDGSKQSYIFDVASETYVQTGSMTNARWYPTVISVGGGKILVTGGLDDQAKALGVVSHNTDTSELYDPATGKWRSVPTLDFGLSDPSEVVAKGATNSTRTLPYYPGLTLLQGGTLFYSGESSGDNGVTPGLWNYNTGAFTPVAALPYPYQRNAGATVLLPPAQDQKVMVMGGGDYSLPATSDTEIINLSNTSSSGSLKWVAGPKLSAAKMYVGAVILPDRTVFETNGASQFREGGVHTAETYDPATNKFTVMNSPTEDRLYHSSAFLEPNGQVAIMGSQPLDASFNMHIAIYSPNYLFKGTRPTVSGDLNEFSYSGKAQGSFTITLPSGTTLAHAELIRPSATTHSTDPDQREVDLAVTKNASGTYSFTPPTDDTLLPEGQYMLFVEDSAGVPSVAKWVSVGAAPSGQVACSDTTCGPPTTAPTTTVPTTTTRPTTTPTPTTRPTATPTATTRPTTTPTPTTTPRPTTTPKPTTKPKATLTLVETSMSGYVAKLTSTSSVAKAKQAVTLQVLTKGVWKQAMNSVTGSTGKATFTWGGHGTLQLRAVIPATGVTSHVVSVTYRP